MTNNKVLTARIDKLMDELLKQVFLPEHKRNKKRIEDLRKQIVHCRRQLKWQ